MLQIQLYIVVVDIVVVVVVIVVAVITILIYQYRYFGLPHGTSQFKQSVSNRTSHHCPVYLNVL